MAKKMMLIINPHAGKMRIKNELLNIINIFSKSEFEVCVFPTQKKSDATRMVKEKALEYDLVVCCGGDGTLNEVINGLLDCETSVSLGCIPTGTTNDFANSLGLSRDIRRAAKDIATGRIFKYDIGCFNDRHFTYVASFGAFTGVAYNTAQQMKNAFGTLAYTLESIKHFNILPHKMKIEHDGGIVEGEFIFGAVLNSTSVGGLIKLSPDEVRLDDGVFEVLLIKNPPGPIEVSNIIAGLLTQNYSDEYVTFFHASKINFASEDNIAWCLDGEYGGKMKKADILCGVKSIDFIVPRDFK